MGEVCHHYLWGLLVLGLALHLASARLAVMSIDLGGEYMKIALVKPGVPMEIVLNKESNRKTQSMVAFRDGERHFGNQAETTALKSPSKAVGYLLQIVGRYFDDPQVQLYRKRFPQYNLIKDEERGTVLYKIDEDTIYSVEELLGMILEKAKEYAQAFAEQEIKDAVITVPAFFNQAERRAVKTAAQLAGINVLQLMSDNAAVALNYGIFRRKNFNTTTQYYMFYDMGSTSTTATIVGYNVVKTKEGTKAETNPQLTIKGVGFDRTLGGLEYTLRLRSHLAKSFNQLKKTPSNVEENDKSMAKLLKESERVKKVLSANVDHHAQVENLIDDKDMRIAVTRAELEEMTKDLTDRVIKPIEEALKVSDITLPEITEVILMGGGTRMPKVQEALTTFLGRSELGKSINTDEAAALGAVYQAAFLGKGFKVKKFGVREGNIYPINVEFERQKNDEETDDKNRVVKRTLFGRMNPFPQKKVMTFNKHTKDFSFDVVYGGLEFLTEEDRQTFGSFLISRYQLQGVEEALSKNKDKAEVKGIKAHFQLDGSGLLSLDRVESVFEKNASIGEEKSTWSKLGSAIGGLFGGGTDDEPKVEDQPETAGGDDTSTVDADDSRDTKSGGAEADEAAADKETDDRKEDSAHDTNKEEQPTPDQDNGSDDQKEEEEEKSSKEAGEKQEEETDKSGSEKKAEDTGSKEQAQTDKTDNSTDKSGKKEDKTQEKVPKAVVIKETIQTVSQVLDVKDLSQDRFKASQKRLSDLTKADTEKAELEQAKNELESFIFDFQDKLGQEEYEKCSTQEEREKLFSAFSETSDWLYEHSEEGKKSDFKEKLKALKDKTKNVKNRVTELQERPKALNALKELLNQSDYFLATIKNFSNIEDPIYTPVEIETLEKLINETKKWRDDTVAAQKKLKPSENPVLLVEDVGYKIVALEREQRYLINKLKSYKPKAKPKKKEDNTAKPGDNKTEAETVSENPEDKPTPQEEAEDETILGDTEKEDPAQEDQTETPAPTEKSESTSQETPAKKRPKSKRKEEPVKEEEVLELDAGETVTSKTDKRSSEEELHVEL